eukprot:11563806-Ditylum_brightwellii.AAC.1
MRTEMGKLFKSVQQCGSFSVANLKRSMLTNLEETAMGNGMAEEKRTARKAIVTLLTKRCFSDSSMETSNEHHGEM